MNSKRKQILELLDSKVKVPNTTLGVYGLTTYFEESFDSSLHEKIYFFKNDLRAIKHLGGKFNFMPKQEEALNVISKNSRILFSAPTSFGKTLLVKEYIYRDKPKKVIYIVPTNSLAYELEKSFKENTYFSFYDIFDRSKNTDLNDNNENLLFIGTQEKFLELSDYFKSNIDLFIIDEAYKLQDSTSLQRGYKLSKTFFEFAITNSKNVMLLSPNAKFIGFDKYDFTEYSTLFNAVDKNFVKISLNNFNSKIFEKAEKEKTILFCNSPNDIRKFSDEISSLTIEAFEDRFVESISEEFHKDWTVVKLLKKKILVHHGQMPKYIQNKMIDLFNSSDNYNLLVGTNSISEGINTPTKNLFIHPNIKLEGRNSLLIKNTIGRAGRLGEYPIGYIYSDRDIQKYIENETIIELSISEDDDLLELTETLNEELIDVFCNEYKLKKEFYYYIIEKYKISLRKFKRILKVFKKNLKYASIQNFVFMLNDVFGDDYKPYNAEYDKFLINSILNKSFVNEDGIHIVFGGLDVMISYIKLKTPRKDIENSEIIDKYMNFYYSTLEYLILPIVSIGKDLFDFDSDWEFGKNVLESIKEFNKKYYNKMYGVDNLDTFTDQHVEILNTLREYGIPSKVSLFSLGMLEEIDAKLNTRYSSYDVINTIKTLANENSQYKSKYKYIVSKYF